MNISCLNCKKPFSEQAPGTKNRNHCPFCLYSVHIDVTIGDRQNKCLGLMKPVAKTLKPDGEEVLVHKCQKCGEIRKNRVAGDDDFGAVESLKTVEDFNDL